MCDKALVMCQNYDDLIEEAAKLLRFYAANIIGEPYLQINRLANDLEYQAEQIAADEWGKQDDEAGYLQEELSTLNENYERILRQRNQLRDALIWLVKVNSDDSGKPLNDAAENGLDVLNTIQEIKALPYDSYTLTIF